MTLEESRILNCSELESVARVAENWSLVPVSASKHPVFDVALEGQVGSFQAVVVVAAAAVVVVDIAVVVDVVA